MLPICGDLYRAGGFATEGMEVAEQAWVHALGVAGLMLEQLTSARPVAGAGEGNFTLRDLLDGLVQPGLRHRSAKVGRGGGGGGSVWDELAVSGDCHQSLADRPCLPTDTGAPPAPPSPRRCGARQCAAWASTAPWTAFPPACPATWWCCAR